MPFQGVYRRGKCLKRRALPYAVKLKAFSHNSDRNIVFDINIGSYLYVSICNFFKYRFEFCNTIHQITPTLWQLNFMRIKKICTYINDLWKNRFSESLGNTICQQNINNHFHRVWAIWIILVYDWICVNIFSWFHIKMSFWFCLCFLSFLMKKVAFKLYFHAQKVVLARKSQWVKNFIIMVSVSYYNLYTKPL